MKKEEKVELDGKQGNIYKSPIKNLTPEDREAYFRELIKKQIKKKKRENA